MVNDIAVRDIVPDMTARLLGDAGISAGMRVLDVGCGRGDVTCMAAGLVGDDGLVVGLDRNQGATSMARARAAERGLANVEFVVGDLAAPPGDRGPYDAVIGRRVLMYQPDRVAALRALAEVLRPGGLAVFQENDMSMVPASPTPHPLHDQVYGWIRQTIEREGATLAMGFELPSALADAGLAVESVRAEAVVQTATRRHIIATIVRAMSSRIITCGVASEADIAIDTLDARLAEELGRTKVPYIGDMVFSAWARKPL
ncbi:methyltransferase domain-containing protein [Haliangium sp.]|uniref:methyltransferase domain-containing protein n=1 Tax=Haliangium sp. TaxID=2663208 RepID=UPI003D0C49F2